MTANARELLRMQSVLTAHQDVNLAIAPRGRHRGALGKSIGDCRSGMPVHQKFLDEPLLADEFQELIRERHS